MSVLSTCRHAASRTLAALLLIGALLAVSGLSPASAQPEHRLEVSVSSNTLFAEPDLFVWPSSRNEPDSYFDPSGLGLAVTYHRTLDRPWLALFGRVRYSRYTVNTDGIVDGLVTCSSDCIETNTISFSKRKAIDLVLGGAATVWSERVVSPYVNLGAGIAITHLTREGVVRYVNDDNLPRNYPVGNILRKNDRGLLVGGTTDVQAGVQIRFLDTLSMRAGAGHRFVLIRGKASQVFAPHVSLIRDFY
jgi:hypothetical protein